MNFSGFKKVSQDEHKATFRHEKLGHELTIAHKSLSPKLKSQLDEIPIHKMADGGGVQGYSENSDKVIDQSQVGAPPMERPEMLPAYSDTSMGVPATSGSESPPPSSAASVDAPQPTMVPSAVAQPTEAPPQATDAGMSGIAAANKSQMSAMEQEKRGQQGIETAKGALGAAQAAQESDYQKQINQTMGTYQDTMKHLMDQNQKFQSDIDSGHINPNRYIDNMSTGKTIRTAMGLILGGMGAGLTHGPNLAFQYLQNQVDRDIDSQKAELGKKQNLLSHNLQMMGNLRSATDLTRLQLGDMLNSHLRMESAKAATPMAQASSQMIGGMWDAKKAELMRNIALQKAMMGASQGTNQEDAFKRQMTFLRMNGNEAMAKDMEAKHVPGVGQASKEVPAEVMKELTARQDLQKQVGALRQWAQQNSGSMDPAVKNYGQALASQVQDAYRRANGQGVFREAEADFVKGIVEQHPTKFLNSLRVDPKYKALEDSNLSTLNNLKSGYGLPVTHAPAAQQIKTVNGVRYLRGPHGEAIPMKNDS